MINEHMLKQQSSKDTTMRWIEVVQPTEQELQQLMENYNLPRDYLYDANDPYEVPRVEGLDDPRPNLFVMSYPILINQSTYLTRVVSVIVFDQTVITVRNENSPVFQIVHPESFDGIAHDRIENFVIALAWNISKTFVDYIVALDERIQQIQHNIRKSTRSDALYEMIEIHKSLIQFQTAIEENNHVMKGIFEMEYLSQSSQRDDLLHDLLVENKQAQIMIHTSMLMVDHLSDMYSNVINNNLNTIMKVLTSITIIMTIPTIIGGLWGMNVKLPFENHDNAFWYMIFLSVLLSGIIIVILRKKDYL